MREDDEWGAGHAASARHVPLGTLDPSAFSTLPAGMTILTVCRSGRRSARAAAGLSVKGDDGQAGTIA